MKKHKWLWLGLLAATLAQAGDQVPREKPGGKRFERAFEPQVIITTRNSKQRQIMATRSVSVARVGHDGNIETFCTSDAKVAREWMARVEGVDQ